MCNIVDERALPRVCLNFLRVSHWTLSHILWQCLIWLCEGHKIQLTLGLPRFHRVSTANAHRPKYERMDLLENILRVCDGSHTWSQFKNIYIYLESLFGITFWSWRRRWRMWSIYLETSQQLKRIRIIKTEAFSRLHQARNNFWSLSWRDKHRSPAKDLPTRASSDKILGYFTLGQKRDWSQESRTFFPHDS